MAFRSNIGEVVLNIDLLAEAIMDSLDCAGVDISIEQAVEAAKVMQGWIENMNLGAPDTGNYIDREVADLERLLAAERNDHEARERLWEKEVKRTLGSNVYLDRDGRLMRDQLK